MYIFCCFVYAFVLVANKYFFRLLLYFVVIVVCLLYCFVCIVLFDVYCIVLAFFTARALQKTSFLADAVFPLNH